MAMLLRFRSEEGDMDCLNSAAAGEAMLSRCDKRNGNLGKPEDGGRCDG